MENKTNIVPNSSYYAIRSKLTWNLRIKGKAYFYDKQGNVLKKFDATLDEEAKTTAPRFDAMLDPLTKGLAHPCKIPIEHVSTSSQIIYFQDKHDNCLGLFLNHKTPFKT